MINSQKAMVVTIEYRFSIQSCLDFVQIFLQILNDKLETSLQSELVSISIRDSSDSEELGFITKAKYECKQLP